MADQSDQIYDVAVIGAGVVGSAVARDLSHYELDVALVEAADDVGTGTSKANTAILHTGFDATPGSLEATLVRRGHELLTRYAQSVGIPLVPAGAIMVAWDNADEQRLDHVAARAVANGYGACERLTAAQVYEAEPSLAPGAVAGLMIPDESVICTFTTPIAFATEAVMNGADLLLGRHVVTASIDPDGQHVLAFASGGFLRARWVVNCAGLFADEVNRLFGHAGFTVHPRRGELIVFDKAARGLLNHILLPVPQERSKGVLIAPTVYGNVLLGPTAEEVTDRADVGSTSAGIAELRGRGVRILPGLLQEDVNATYVGLRAATEHPEYQIFCEAQQRYVCAGGIRSTGLTSSMAIAEHVVSLMGSAGLALVKGDGRKPLHMPFIGEAGVRPYQDAATIARDPAYGEIVCHCERVTLGEIRDAMSSLIPATGPDGLRRRTRAQMGRCQGFYCGAEVSALLASSANSAAQ